MRILFIVNKFPVLSESFILDQITGLIDLGHEVSILARSKIQQNVVHDDVHKYELLSKIIYIEIPRSKVKRIVKGFIWLIQNIHKNTLLILKTFNFFRYRGKVISLELLYQIMPFLHCPEYDIIHAHFGPSGLVSMHLKDLGALKGKFIVTFHGFDVTVPIKNYGKNYYKELFRKVDKITYNSKATREKLRNIGCPLEKSKQLLMGINLEKYIFREKNIKFGDQINILSLGRLIEMKGQEYAIKAVAKLTKEYPNLKYNIIGDGPLKSKLSNLIKELNVKENIKILGWVSDERLSAFYRNAHIFLHPSVISSDGNQEGQGVVLQEAQASGLIVVATKHSAFPEGVLDGKSGYLVPERDIDALTDRLDYLIKHPEQWPAMGKAGRIFVERKYDTRLLCKELENIYESML